MILEIGDGLAPDSPPTIEVSFATARPMPRITAKSRRVRGPPRRPSPRPRRGGGAPSANRQQRGPTTGSSRRPSCEGSNGAFFFPREARPGGGALVNPTARRAHGAHMDDAAKGRGGGGSNRPVLHLPVRSGRLRGGLAEGTAASGRKPGAGAPFFDRRAAPGAGPSRRAAGRRGWVRPGAAP